MKTTTLALISLCALFAGCESTEEYEVTGQVTSAATVAGPISLEFFEVEDTDRVSIKAVELAQLGPFTETIEAGAESKIVALAIVDTDKDGKCTAGELWDEADVVRNADGTLAPLSLTLTNAACPAAK